MTYGYGYWIRAIEGVPVRVGCQPCCVHHGTTLSSQADAEHALVQDRNNLVLKLRQSVMRGCEKGMSLCALACSLTLQPANEAFRVA